MALLFQKIWRFFCDSPTWNPKQPFINGCFNWMIPNLYIGNGCFTKHPFINGCLGFQAVFSVLHTVNCKYMCILVIHQYSKHFWGDFVQENERLLPIIPKTPRCFDSEVGLPIVESFWVKSWAKKPTKSTMLMGKFTSDVHDDDDDDDDDDADDDDDDDDHDDAAAADDDDDDAADDDDDDDGCCQFVFDYSHQTVFKRDGHRPLMFLFECIMQ